MAALDGKKKIRELPKGADELSKLLQAFYSQPALTVESVKDLARRMAGMTGIIRELINATFDHGSPKDQKQLQYWLKAFREVLLPDLDKTKFADMFTQTVAYGLFDARPPARPPHALPPATRPGRCAFSFGRNSFDHGWPCVLPLLFQESLSDSQAGSCQTAKFKSTLSPAAFISLASFSFHAPAASTGT